MGKCDDFVKTAIRRKVHKFFFHNEAPIINKGLLAVTNDPNLPHMGRTSLYELLKSIGFEFIKKKKLIVRNFR